MAKEIDKQLPLPVNRIKKTEPTLLTETPHEAALAKQAKHSVFHTVIVRRLLVAIVLFAVTGSVLITGTRLYLDYQGESQRSEDHVTSLAANRSKSELDQSVIIRGFFLFTSVVVKILAVSIGVLVLTHIVIIRHIKSIAEFTDQLTLNGLNRPLTLNRKTKATSDELDKIVDSFNRLQNERIKYDSGLESNSRELREINERKDQFLRNLTNEVKEPINNMVKIAESMLDNRSSETPAKEDENLYLLISSGKKLLLQTNDILDFSRLKHNDMKLERRPVYLQSLLELVLSLVKPMLISKDLTINVCLTDGLPPINADEPRVQQVLYAIVSNAVKYTDKGSVSISAIVEGDMVLVRIVDTGRGIAEEKLNRFFQTCDIQVRDQMTGYSHSGLGICIAKKLVELHGGEFLIFSGLGQGTEVSISFPRALQKQRHDTEKSLVFQKNSRLLEAAKNYEMKYKDPERKNHPNFKILVIEDDKVDHFILENFLKEENYDVILASDGLEGLKLLDEEKPDLILLDIIMPGIGGFEVCERIRENYSPSELPVIFLSSNKQVNSQIHGFTTGANDYLAKPVIKGELIARIQNQIKLMLANRRMSSLLDFSRKVGEIKDAKLLFQKAFDFLQNNIYFNYGCIKFNGEIICSSGTPVSDLSQDYLQIVSGQSELKQTSVTDHNPGSALLFSVKGFEQFRIYLFRGRYNGQFSENALKYITNLFKEAHSIRDLVLNSMGNNPVSAAIVSIKQKLDAIKYIESASPFCNVVVEDERQAIEIAISMKEIELYFGDTPLYRVHRKFFVNPEKATSIKKKNQKDYELVFDTVVIPIGRTYLKQFKTKHSYLFNQ